MGRVRALLSGIRPYAARNKWRLTFYVVLVVVWGARLNPSLTFIKNIDLNVSQALESVSILGLTDAFQTRFSQCTYHALVVCETATPVRAPRVAQRPEHNALVLKAPRTKLASPAQDIKNTCAAELAEQRKALFASPTPTTWEQEVKDAKAGVARAPLTPYASDPMCNPQLLSEPPIVANGGGLPGAFSGEHALFLAFDAIAQGRLNIFIATLQTIPKVPDALIYVVGEQLQTSRATPIIAMFTFLGLSALVVLAGIIKFVHDRRIYSFLALLFFAPTIASLACTIVKYVFLVFSFGIVLPIIESLLVIAAIPWIVTIATAYYDFEHVRGIKG